MGEKDDSAWVFDSLVGFLQGPIWSAPLLTFIEEKSLIFDSETEDSEEYRHVYQEYKNLVDLLLGCYMEDMGITPEQFEHACSLNKNTKMPIQFQQSLFEQIWAANEYDIFKRMMIQKNLELQLQALNLIEQKFGLTPASLMCESDSLHDELVMEELLHKEYEKTDDDTGVDSDEAMRIEYQRLSMQYKTERQLLQRALKESANSSSSVSPEPEKRGIEELVRVEPLQLINKALESKKLNTLEPIPRREKTSEVKDEEEVEDEKKAPSVVQKVGHDNARGNQFCFYMLVSRLTDIYLQKSSDQPAAKSVSYFKEADEEEMKRRQIYLKTQRDKLLSMKKEARSQRLKTTATRPGSARVAAEASMSGKQDFEASQLLDTSKIQVRKALAARLKAEVVHKC